MGFVVDDGRLHAVRPTSSIRLRLEKTDYGAVTLIDENDWFILTVNSDGTITRHTSVSALDHYKLDPDGRVIDTDITPKRRRRK